MRFLLSILVIMVGFGLRASAEEFAVVDLTTPAVPTFQVSDKTTAFPPPVPPQVRKASGPFVWPANSKIKSVYVDSSGVEVVQICTPDTCHIVPTSRFDPLSVIAFKEIIAFDAGLPSPTGKRVGDKQQVQLIVTDANGVSTPQMVDWVGSGAPENLPFPYPTNAGTQYTSGIRGGSGNCPCGPSCACPPGVCPGGCPIQRGAVVRSAPQPTYASYPSVSYPSYPQATYGSFGGRTTVGPGYPLPQGGCPGGNCGSVVWYGH